MSINFSVNTAWKCFQFTPTYQSAVTVSLAMYELYFCFVAHDYVYVSCNMTTSLPSSVLICVTLYVV